MNKLAGVGMIIAVLLGGCAGQLQPPPRRAAPPAPPGLFITEVAHDTLFGGSRADKVEVVCAAAEGCEQFRVCDSVNLGMGACSALQGPLGAGQRSVVSRGNALAPSDMVWLADAQSEELRDTRVGPFECASQASRARPDCPSAAFAPCGAPNLGVSSGVCQDDANVVMAPRFTTNQHGQPESSCQRPACQQLLAAIAGAQRSIDFAIYGIRNQPEVMNALVTAQARGVRVRGVVDGEDKDCSRFGYPDTPQLRARLTEAAVKCDLGPGFSSIMHHKFFVFDGARVWTGSTNISDTELGGEYNTDVAVIFNAPALAQVYTAELDEMFTAGRFHRRKLDDTPHQLTLPDGTPVDVFFSPSDRPRERAVLPLIQQTKSTLDIAMFFFTDDSIAEALLDAKRRGVQVRMVLDAGGAANAYSKHGKLCAAGIPVKVENWGGKSHSKWAVSDSARVLFGSMNWTGAGDAGNDENTLVVGNTGLAQAFGAEFVRQWADLPDSLICARVAAEGAGSSDCGPARDCERNCASGACCDHVDNDFDGHADGEDEACRCGDGIDNDHDGHIDAADFECRNQPSDP